MAFFHRPRLADELVSRILGKSAIAAGTSGLFLEAPRRTGKSTFIREDLRPALQTAGATVIYVDLWEDQTAEPGSVIVNAVRAALSEHDGVVKRLARAAGMDKVTVGGLSFSLDRVGLGKEVSLTTALAALSDETKRPIALIIDEAQHAITSEAGSAALFALKAARDELNSSSHHGLRIVATGSNRDKLAMLRSSKDQAFFGAPLVSFPHLADDYIEWFVAQLPFSAELDQRTVFASFREAGFRPELLSAAAAELLYDLEVRPGQYAARMDELIRERIAASDADALKVVHSLTPLQSAVLRVLAIDGDAYAPFEEATMKRYGAILKATAANYPVTPETNNVQAALSALQDKKLVWRASRGVYALEDSFLADLMRKEGLLDIEDGAGPGDTAPDFGAQGPSATSLRRRPAPVAGVIPAARAP